MKTSASGPVWADMARWRGHVRLVSGFALVSGTGWLIDFCLFTVLVWASAPVAFANFTGATVAVVFVYFASVRAIFRYRGHFLWAKFVAYAVYQFIAIALASWLIAWLAECLGDRALLSKILVTPLTFLANYCFMLILTRSQEPIDLHEGVLGPEGSREVAEGSARGVEAR